MRNKKGNGSKRPSRKKATTRRTIFKNETWYAKAALSIAVKSEQATLVPQAQPLASLEETRLD
jgi:hypothetical protein